MSVLAMASWKGSERSAAGVLEERPLSSTTLPAPLSLATAHLPTSEPMRRLSAPMKHEYLSPATARSSTITGMPALYASATACVSEVSLGEMMITSTLAETNSRTWACWETASFCASFMMSLICGCLAALSWMSESICSRHGSLRLHCE